MKTNRNKLKKEIAGLSQLNLWDNPHAIGEIIKIKRNQLKRLDNENGRKCTMDKTK